jgi:ABC-type transport system involved in multi-copper enzyme maturation permease subunit
MSPEPTLPPSVSAALAQPTPTSSTPDSSASLTPVQTISQMAASVVPEAVSRPVKSLADTVWTKVDRKATAVAEFTIKQYRTRKSTWVVGGISTMVILLVLTFYVDRMADVEPSIDQDGDGADWDGDGYPAGQEWQYGTSDSDESLFPGSPYFEYEGLYTEITANGTFRGTGNFQYNWVNTSVPPHQEARAWMNWNDHVVFEDMVDCPENNDNWVPWDAGVCRVDEDEIRIRGRTVTGNGTFTSFESWEQFEFGSWIDGHEVEPEPRSKYIDEDGIDWDGDLNNPNQGFDDDGDCLSLPIAEQDQNGDGIPCNVLYIVENGTIIDIIPDKNVDEDPDDAVFLKEVAHRSFISIFGRVGFLFILGIFIPLFLATGLIRDEFESGTLYYLLCKPIARAEVFAYRLLGFLGLAWPFLILLILATSLVTGFFGPGESLFRFSDIAMWTGVAVAVCLTVLAYAAIFATFGIISPKYGMFLSLIYAIYEFVMMFLGLFQGVRQSGISLLSVSFWGSEIVNATAWLVWDDSAQMSEQAEAFGWLGEVALGAVWLDPFPTAYPLVNLILSVTVLLGATLLFIWIGQAFFKRREID